MLALGVPMWILYWASIAIGWLVARRRSKAAAPTPSTA